MNFKSKKMPLVILGVTSILCSRAMFAFFNDPEGPNLLIVIGLAVIVYFLSLAVYFSTPTMNDLKRLLLAIFVQILIVAALFVVGITF